MEKEAQCFRCGVRSLCEASSRVTRRRLKQREGAALPQAQPRALLGPGANVPPSSSHVPLPLPACAHHRSPNTGPKFRWCVLLGSSAASARDEVRRAAGGLGPHRRSPTSVALFASVSGPSPPRVLFTSPRGSLNGTALLASAAERIAWLVRLSRVCARRISRRQPIRST